MPNHEKWSHPWTVHTSCPKIPVKKFMKTFSWCLDAGKLFHTLDWKNKWGIGNFKKDCGKEDV